MQEDRRSKSSRFIRFKYGVVRSSETDGAILGCVDILNFEAVCRRLALKIGVSQRHLHAPTSLDSRLRGNDGLEIRNVNRT